MLIRINGVNKDVPTGTTVASLLQRLCIAPTGVAVAVNRVVVPRTRHNKQALHEEDQVEIIHAVGGG